MKPSKWIVVGWLAGLAALAATVALPDLKKQFEAGVRTAQQQQREQIKTASERYLAALTVAEQRVQAAGNEPVLTWVRAERKRFEEAGDMPESALGRGPLLRLARGREGHGIERGILSALVTAGAAHEVSHGPCVDPPCRRGGRPELRIVRVSGDHEEAVGSPGVRIRASERRCVELDHGPSQDT